MFLNARSRKATAILKLFRLAFLLILAGLTVSFAQEDFEAAYVVVVYPPDRDNGFETGVVFMFRDEFYEKFPGILDRPLPMPPGGGAGGGGQPDPGPCGAFRAAVDNAQDALADTQAYLQSLINGAPYITFNGTQYVTYLPGTPEHNARILEVIGWVRNDKNDIATAISNWGECQGE